MRMKDFVKGLGPLQEELGDRYLDQFHDPIVDDDYGQKCNACGAYITGLLGVANYKRDFDGQYREGTCYDCGHPFRFKHEIKDVGVLDNVPLCFKNRIKLVGQ